MKASKNQLQEHFSECIPLFIALGDETRLTIIQCLFELEHSETKRNVPGLNVKEITQQTNLSRPAVSHHLKILKDAGLIDICRKGVCNYYYLTGGQATDTLIRLGMELRGISNS